MKIILFIEIEIQEIKLFIELKTGEFDSTVAISYL